MISWRIPTVYGAMAFSASTSETIWNSGGFTYSADETATTNRTSYSYATVQLGIATTLVSFSEQILRRTLTEETSTTKTVNSYIAVTTSTLKTFVDYTTQNTSISPFFTFKTSQATYSEKTKINILSNISVNSTTTVGTASTANTYDTVYQAEGNEYFVYFTDYLYASTWDLLPIDARSIVSSDSRFTMRPNISTSNAFVVDDNVAGEYITDNDKTYTVAHEYLSYGSNLLSITAYSINKIPNISYSFVNTDDYEMTIAQSTSTLTAFTSQNIQHKGNTATIKYVIPKSTTRMGIVTNFLTDFPNVSNGKTFSELLRITFDTTTLTYTHPYYLKVSTTPASGNTSYIENTKQQLLFQDRPLHPFLYNPTCGCSIIKTVGVHIGTEVGLFYTFTGTTISGGQLYAGLGRVPKKANNLTLTTYSTPSWTMRGKSVTYTVSSSNTTTTNSGIISVGGSTTSSIINEKYALGGKPESEATYYQFADQFGWLDQNRNFTFFDGIGTTYDSSQSQYFNTSHLETASVINIDFENYYYEYSSNRCRIVKRNAESYSFT